MTSLSAEQLRGRIASYLLNDGLHCSECLLVIFRGQLGQRARNLEAAVLPLSRGLAGTGGVCGAYIAALLAMGLLYGDEGRGSRRQQAAPIGYPRDDAPMNDWLDAVPREGVEPPVFAPCRELAARISKAVGTGPGSLNCPDISGVNWSTPAHAELERYYGPEGGLARCVEIIAAAVEALHGLLEETRSGGAPVSPSG